MIRTYLLILICTFLLSGCCVFERYKKSNPSLPTVVKGWHEPIKVYGNYSTSYEDLGDFVLKVGEQTPPVVLEENTAPISIKLVEVVSGDPCAPSMEYSQFTRGVYQVIRTMDNVVLSDKLTTDPPNVRLGEIGLKAKYYLWENSINTKDGWVHFSVRR